MNCSSFEVCSAPICPLDLNGKALLIWFPDEEICRKKELQRNPIVQAQKKIKKKAKNIDTFYSLEMLERKCLLRKGISGIHPDSAYGPQLKSWKKKHPPLSAAYKETFKNLRPCAVPLPNKTTSLTPKG